jgi:hypothetical protein
MGVADLGPADLPGPPFAQYRPAGEAVVDLATHQIDCTEAGVVATLALSRLRPVGGV